MPMMPLPSLQRIIENGFQRILMENEFRIPEGGPKLSEFSILQSLRSILFSKTYHNSLLRKMPWLGLVFVLLKFSIIAQVPHFLLNLVS